MTVFGPCATNARQGGRKIHTLAAFCLTATLASGLAGCAGRHVAPPTEPQMPVSPETLVTDSGAALSAPEFAVAFLRADYILVGEEHPNPCDHLAQAGVIRRLVAAGKSPAIGLEMVPADYQPILDAFNAGKLAVDDLPRALDWRHTWGYDFALYAPVFEVAREAKLPIYALNAPKGLARKVAHVGLAALSPAERAALPGAILPPDPAQADMLRHFFKQHAAMLEKAGKKRTGPDPFANFLTVQALWDTQMAQRALLAHAATGRPVVIVAGAGHVERGWGIARRLAVLDPGAKIATVMPWRGGDAPDKALADIFYSCPTIQRSRLGMTLSREAPAKGEAVSPLLVTAVSPDSPAAKAGLLAGDAVTAAGGQPATDLAVLHTAAMEALKTGAPLRLTVLRAGETLSIAIPLALPPATTK